MITDTQQSALPEFFRANLSALIQKLFQYIISTTSPAINADSTGSF